MSFEVCTCQNAEVCALHGYPRSCSTEEEARSRRDRAHLFVTASDEGFRVYPVAGGWHADYGGGACFGKTKDEAIREARSAVERDKRLRMQIIAEGRR